MKIVFIFIFVLSTLIFAQNNELIDYYKKIQEKQKESEKLKPGWNNELQSSLTVTQTSYHNWKSGGANVFVWMVNIDGSAILDSSNYSWANYLNLFYGTSRQNGQETRKTNDLFELESVYSIKNAGLLNPYMSTYFRSQLTAGYDYTEDTRKKISDFLDPAYLVNGLGIGYEKDRLLRTRIGYASRVVYTKNYNVYADGEKIKYDDGLQWVSRVETKLLENILLKTKLDVFTSFDELRDANVNWDTLLQASLTQYVVVNLQTLLTYDPRIFQKAQIKEVLSVGLRYSFI